MTTRLAKWLSSPRILRRLLIALAWIITLIALFYGEEHWRGKRAWTQYRRELEGRGEQLDFAVLVPKPIPDDQNFAATPFVKSWFLRATNSESQAAQDDRWKDDFAQADKLVSTMPIPSSEIMPPGVPPSSPDSTNNPPTAQRHRSENGRNFVDLVAWAQAFTAVRSGKSPADDQIRKKEQDRETRAQAAPAVLAGLRSSEPLLDELKAAAEKPRSVYPIVYDLDNPWGIRLPHLIQLKNACRRLQLRACAELAAGDSSAAFKDIELLFRIEDSVVAEPLVISYLVRIACLQLATQAIWEGLAEQQWKDDQLKSLEERLAACNLFSDLKSPLDTERAAAILTVDLLQRGKYNLNDLGAIESEHPANGPATVNFIGRIVPGGWYDLERLNYCLSFDTLLKGTMDAASERVWPDRVEANGREFERQLFGGHLSRSWNVVGKHRLIAAMLLPALGNISRKAAQGQTAVNQAAIACALERYRLANGHFPEKLEELVPQFSAQLPHDVITGEPFHYRRDPDGRFTLYSVGWDQKDDGGTPGKSLFDDKAGDWLWEYPPTKKLQTHNPNP